VTQALLKALGLSPDATAEDALEAIAALRTHAAGPPTKTDPGTATPGPDTTTTAEWLDRFAKYPASIVKLLKLPINATKADVDACWDAYLKTLDDARDTTTSIAAKPKSDLGLAADADEVSVIARLRSIASMRDAITKNSAAVKFHIKVVEARDADPKLTVADAQRQVSAEEPELYSAIQMRRDYDRTDFNRFSASRVLAEEARRIVKDEGCTLAEAQRLASQRWPEIANQRVTGSGEVAR